MKLSRRHFIQATALSLASTSAFGFSFNFGKKTEEVQNIGKTLIIYFSQTGTTKFLAKEIHKRIGGDIFEVKAAKPYIGTYKQLKIIAQDEQDRNFRPKLESLPDISSYDTIVFGFPTWLYTMPMVMFTLIENVDFSNKNIIPFNTHGGTGFSSSLRHFKQISPKSKIYEGIEILDVDLEDSSNQINSWLKDLGFTKA